MPEFSDPERRVLVTVDMESYGGRTNVLQHRAQKAIISVLDDATAELGLDRLEWRRQPGGDGEFAVLPSGAGERVVVARLAPIVDRLLRQHNQGLLPAARVRLRIGVHQGLVHLDGPNGYPGEAVVHVCRLVASPQVKQKLRQFPSANVALILSDALYRDVIRHYEDLRPEQFARVEAVLEDKDFSATAWIYVPGENAARPDAAESASGPAPSPPGTESQPVTPAGQTFSNITTHGPAAFGSGITQNIGGPHR